MKRKRLEVPALFRSGNLMITKDGRGQAFYRVPQVNYEFLSSAEKRGLRDHLANFLNEFPHTLTWWQVPVPHSPQDVLDQGRSQVPADRLKAWEEMDLALRSIHWSMRGKLGSETWERFARPLETLKGLTAGDRLLSGVYWEKLAFFSVLDGDFSGAALSYRRALQEGHPTGHLKRNLARALELARPAGEAPGQGRVHE